MYQPVFSIITVVFNGKDLLEGTARSVFEQTYPHLEYWVIDGGSTDGTVDVLKNLQTRMPHMKWISEPDRGLYDAMNKGLSLATGDFVWFLNAGDHLYAPTTVAQLALQYTPDTDVFYGETLLVDDARRPVGSMSELSTRKLPRQLNWQQYLNGMLVVHQSFVARRSLAPQYRLDNLCADYDWCIRILKKSRKNTPANAILTQYLMGGMSKKKHWQSLKDRFLIMQTHFGWRNTLLAHGWIVVRAICHQWRRLCLPKY